MFAVVYDRFGPPEVLHLGEVEEPYAGPGTVRVRVRAAGVTPVDAGVRAGSPMARATVAFPHVPGVDASGTVDEIGDGVTGVTVGDEVFGAVDIARLGGATAQFAVLRFWAPKPVSMSWAEAAASGTSVETATRVVDLLDVQSGSSLLVDGASGGVGSAVVQLAVARGVQVVGSCRAASVEFVRGLGAVPVVYGAGLAERVRALGISPRAAVDVSGVGSLPELIAATGSPERVVTIADPAAAAHGVRMSWGSMAGETSGEHGLRVAAELSLAGRFRMPVRQVFAAGDAARAHAAVETGPQQGKVVIAGEW